MYSGESSWKREQEEDTFATPRKKPALALPPPSSATPMRWTPKEEILIVTGIDKFQKETGKSYASNWDAFYNHIQGSIHSLFTREQLLNKVKKLKRKYTENLAKQASLTNPTHKQLFNLSHIIWDQPKDVLVVEIKEDDFLCHLKKTLHSTVSFPSVTRDQEESMLKKLRNLEEALQRKNLAEEWEVLLVEELQLKIKKQAFSKKVLNA